MAALALVGAFGVGALGGWDGSSRGRPPSGASAGGRRDSSGAGRCGARGGGSAWSPRRLLAGRVPAAPLGPQIYQYGTRWYTQGASRGGSSGSTPGAEERKPPGRRGAASPEPPPSERCPRAAGPLRTVLLWTPGGEEVQAEPCEGGGGVAALVPRACRGLWARVALHPGFDVISVEIDGQPAAFFSGGEGVAASGGRGAPRQFLDLGEGENSFVVECAYWEEPAPSRRGSLWGGRGNRAAAEPTIVRDQYLLVVQRGSRPASPAGQVGQPAAAEKSLLRQLADEVGLLASPERTSGVGASVRGVPASVKLESISERLKFVHEGGRGDTSHPLATPEKSQAPAGAASGSSGGSPASGSLSASKERMKALRLKLQAELADWKAAETKRIDAAVARLELLEAHVQEQGASHSAAVAELRAGFEGRLREGFREQDQRREGLESRLDKVRVDLESDLQEAMGRVHDLVREEKEAFKDHNREVEARIVEQLSSVQALMESSLGEQRSAIDLAETLRGELDGLATSVMARMDAYEDLAGTVECKASALQERLSGVEDWRRALHEQGGSAGAHDLVALERALHVEKKERMAEDHVLVEALNDLTESLEVGLGMVAPA